MVLVSGIIAPDDVDTIEVELRRAVHDLNELKGRRDQLMGGTPGPGRKEV